MFQENAISYKFSDKVFQNSIMWLTAKELIVKVDGNDQDDVENDATQKNEP